CTRGHRPALRQDWKREVIIMSLISMVVVLRQSAAPEERAEVERLLAVAEGLRHASNEGASSVAAQLGGETVLHLRSATLPRRTLARLDALPAVARIVPVTTPYILANRAVHPAKTTVRVGGRVIGGEEPIIVAGPCAVEGEEQIFSAARAAAGAGAHLLRGG